MHQPSWGVSLCRLPKANINNPRKNKANQNGNLYFVFHIQHSKSSTILSSFLFKTETKKKVLDHVKNDQGNAENHFHLVLKDSRMYVKVSIIFDIGRKRSHHDCLLGSTEVTGSPTLTIQAISNIQT